MPARLRILKLVKDVAPARELAGTEENPSPRPWLKALWRVVLLLISGFCLLASFRDVDLRATEALLGGLGLQATLILLPSLLAILVETWAWQSAFAALTARPAYLSLFRIRAITESLGSVLPLGPLWSEAIKPLLLGRHCGLTLPQSLTGMVVRKYMLLCSQGLYLVLGFFVGKAALESGALEIFGSARFAFLALIGGAALFALAEVLGRVFAGGTTARALFNVLLGLPSRRLHAALERCHAQIEQTDGYARRFFRDALRTRSVTVLLCLGAWLLEATETWLILELLGVSIGWGNAVGIEATVVLLRHLLFMLPAGLGAQELGYTLLLGSLGVSVEASAAFAVIKRLRELGWVLLGYVFFLADTKERRIVRLPTALPAQPPLTSSGGE